MLDRFPVWIQARVRQFLSGFEAQLFNCSESFVRAPPRIVVVRTVMD